MSERVEALYNLMSFSSTGSLNLYNRVLAVVAFRSVVGECEMVSDWVCGM
jgi:hypothetical protein